MGLFGRFTAFWFAVAAFSAGSLCGGCSNERPSQTSEATAVPAAAKQPARPAPSPRAKGDGMRLTQAHGVAVDKKAASSGARLDPGTAIEVQAAGRATLDAVGDARFKLEPQGRFQVGRDAPLQLLVFTGAVHAMLPPQGNSSRPPLRVAGPQATAEIGGSGEVWVTVLPNGSCWIAALQGLIEVTGPAADRAKGQEEHALRPGQALVATARGIAEPTSGPTSLLAARRMAATLVEDASQVPPERAAATSVTLKQQLDEALGWLAQQDRAGARMTATHREALARGDRRQAERAQRELIQHSKQRFRLRRVVLTRWEGFQAWHGLQERNEAEPYRARVRRALGLP